MKKQVLSILIALMLIIAAAAITVQAETALPAGGAYMVSHDGTETVAADPAAAWATGNYAYVKLYGQTDAFANFTDKALWVDLNGYDLTVGGSGELYAFDSANDEYDAAACGTLTYGAGIQLQTDVVAPVGANRYLAVVDGNTATFHRLDIRLSTVTLRITEMGLYYKAVYNCDDTLASKVEKYGVVLSSNHMPGADFMEEQSLMGNKCSYTVATDPFESGVIANSGAVFGIMKQQHNAAANSMRGRLKVYANPYILFDLGQKLVVVGDNENAGKTASDESFTGIAYSLCDALRAIDESFYSYTADERNRLDRFKWDWEKSGMAWSFAEIGKNLTIDNSDLVLTDGVGYCPVCKKDVQWKPVVSGADAYKLDDGDHYYLSEDEVTITASSSAFAGAVIAPGGGKTGCLHLNGKKLTAPETCAIYGASGTLNVMGNGTVWGNRNKSFFGDAVQINNEAGGVINLYGGTYTNSGTTGTVITAYSGGGTINIYQDVTVQPGDTSGGVALQFGLGSGRKPAVINIYGAKVLGGLAISRGATTNQNILTLTNAQITSAIKMTASDTIEIKGETAITSITVPEFGKLTLGQLASGSSVGITAQGVFTENTRYAQANSSFFVPSSQYQQVTVRDDVLYCGKDYVSSKPVTGGFCPVCEKNVTWTELSANNAGALNGHYYLASDFTYTGTATSAISASGSGKTACVHLNGNDLTATNTIAIYSGDGVINVMGTGTVAGRTNGSGYGAAVQSDNAPDAGGINLYSGTYQQAADTAADAYTVSVRSGGGNVKIYEDANVLSGISGKAIRIADTEDDTLASVQLLGATVNGEVYLQGSTYSADCSVLTIDDATVNGNVLMDGENTVQLIRAPKVQYLQPSKETALTVDRLELGARITVRAVGRFTKAYADAKALAECFVPANKASTVTAVDGILTYTTDYNRALTFTSGTTAYCPVCEKDVQWTALEANKNGTMLSLSAGHYYLAQDQVFTSSDTTSSYAFVKAPGTGATACLHLNGNDLYATNTKAVYGNSGVLNIMGNGNVAGKISAANQGAAVQVNGDAEESSLNLYGGTYKKYDGTGSDSAVIAIGNAGSISVYQGVTIEAAEDKAIYLGKACDNFKAELNLYGCTVNGDLLTEAPADPASMQDSVLYTMDATINGTVDILAENNVVTFEGKTVIGQLNVKEGLLVNFADMLAGSSVKVSATGVFTKVMGEADHYAPYFTTDDQGDWIINRDYQLVQTAKITQLDATATDKTKLESMYTGRLPYHGELHNHAKTGGKADGNNTLAEWIQLMEERRIDFAAIVDHRQSIHMYLDEWDDACFIGGTEPAVPTLVGSKAKQKTLHYNMIFADAAKFEAHLKAISSFRYTPAEDGNGGFYNYVSFNVSEMQTMVQSVLDHGGFFVHVHPKFDEYIISDDPLDYWFVDGTGLEIATTEGGKQLMNYKDNIEAYELWVDLLELDKRIFATIGNDSHYVSTVESLTTIYATEKTPQAFVDYARAGDMTAGPVGIRMNIGDVTTGGITSFENGRLVLSVGDIHEQVYDPTHQYGIELYDDGGIIFSTEIDPTETTYFAMDTDNSRKFYRAVVVDLTDGVRIAVGNPIWNEK